MNLGGSISFPMTLSLCSIMIVNNTMIKKFIKFCTMFAFSCLALFMLATRTNVQGNFHPL